MTRWVNAKRKLPAPDTYVLVVVKGVVYVGWWDSDMESRGHWIIPDCGPMFNMKPTHWMPMPKLPRGVRPE